MHPFELQLTNAWTPSRWRGLSLAIAVSGGADSIALLRGMARLRASDTRLIVLHFHHYLRGTESDEDARFVRNLAEVLQCEFRCNWDLKTPTQPFSNSSDESSLRTARYHFLEQQALALGARYLVTAHTLEDQAETALFQLLRGSGSGLAGIRPFRASYQTPDLVIARPLLQTRRDTVIDYLKHLQQPFRVDSSNANLSYSRNWIRNDLFPRIEERIPEFKAALARSMQVQQEWMDWIEEQFPSIESQAMLQRDTSGFTVNRLALQSYPWLIVHAFLRSCWLNQNWPLGSMSFDHWKVIREAVFSDRSESFHHVFPGQVRMKREQDAVSFSKTIDEKPTKGESA